LTERSIASGNSTDKEPVRNVVAFALLLVVARLLAAHMGLLTEGDEILIAEGVGVIHNDSQGPVYRYGPQVGYYRFVLATTALLGDLARAPAVMVFLSALAGALIPTLGLLAFPSDLSRRERWLLALALAFNPAIWESSAYGNTAMPSAALVCSALVLLSRRPSFWGEGLALTLFGLAILARADAVLATGGLGLILWRNHGRLRAAFVRVAALGLTIALIYGALVAVDPLMQGFLATVGKHLTNSFITQFWDYLLWGMSPIPLAFAVLGLRELAPRRGWLLATIAAWCIPVFAFYFASTTTPRYHLLVVFPLSVASVVGLVAVTNLFSRGRRLATGIAYGLAFAHAVVAVGRFTPGTKRSWLREGNIPTHDGRFSTGALLYKTYRWRSPDVDRLLAFRYTVPPNAGEWVRALRSGDHTGRRIVLISDGVYLPLLHWIAELERYRVTSFRADNARDCVAFEWTANGAQVSLTDFPRLRDNPSCRIAASAGDEVWIVKPESADGLPQILRRIPTGLVLSAPTPESNDRMARLLVQPHS
jgi:hypothetical protein